VIIAVTGLNTASAPEAGFGVLQSLHGRDKRQDQLIGLAYQPLDTGLFHSGLMHRAFIVPSPATGQETFLGRMGQIKKESGLDVIIPTLEEEVSLFMDMENHLRTAGINTLLPARRSVREMQTEINRQMEKQRESSVKERDDDSPVYNPSMVKNPVSEPTASDPEFFSVTVIANTNSKIVAISSIKKILISRHGGTWAALTVDNDEFMHLASEIVQHTSWQGTLTLEITRYREGEQWISGFRLAFPDWIGLSAMAGANLPSIYIDLIAGKRTRGVAKSAPGKMLIRSSIDVVTDLNHFGEISLNGEINYGQS